MVVDKIQVTDQNGQENPHDIGADSKNVQYTKNDENQTVENKISNLDGHVAKKVTTDATGVHGFRVSSEQVNDGELKLQYLNGNEQLNAASGTGDMAASYYTTPSGGDNIIRADRGGTENKTGYIQKGRKANSSIGRRATAEGLDTIASGDQSHAEGTETEASKAAAHAEGAYTKATGDAAHAEGDSTKAIGDYSHAEGNLSEARKRNSHAEGYQTIAAGIASHAEGEFTEANGDYSFAGGRNIIVTGLGSFAHGIGNKNYKTTFGGSASFGIINGNVSKYGSEADGTKFTIQTSSPSNFPAESDMPYNAENGIYLNGTLTNDGNARTYELELATGGMYLLFYNILIPSESSAVTGNEEILSEAYYIIKFPTRGQLHALGATQQTPLVIFNSNEQLTIVPPVSMLVTEGKSCYFQAQLIRIA